MMKPSVLESILESILEKGSHKKVDAWLGVDSLHGRYMFGVAQVPASGLIDAGQTACITQRCWTWFQGERLFVHRSCASDFLIRDVFCGCHSRDDRIKRLETALEMAESWGKNGINYMDGETLREYERLKAKP